MHDLQTMAIVQCIGNLIDKGGRTAAVQALMLFQEGGERIVRGIFKNDIDAIGIVEEIVHAKDVWVEETHVNFEFTDQLVFLMVLSDERFLKG